MYEQFYNLAGKPFQLSPDPRFFFNSAGHKRALSYLRYGIKQGEGFIIITGNVGTGKSTLVSMLFQMLARENIVGTQVVTTQMGPDDLLRMVAAGYGIPFQRVSKAAILKGLEDFCRACVSEGKRVLLVVDEAQGLPPKAVEELRMLSNFQMNGRSLIQSFLLGQREFRQTMRSKGFEQLRQRVIAAYHLKPLDGAETRSYIEHRLGTAGWNDDPTISAEAFDAVYKFTEGVPRRVNTLCDRLLLFGFLEGLHHIDLDAVRSVTADIVEEQGGGDDEDVAEIPPALSVPVTGNGAVRAAPEDDGRLSAVESSVASLADALKQEMGLLREALLSRSDEEPRRTRREDDTPE